MTTLVQLFQLKYGAIELLFNERKHVIETINLSLSI